MTFPVGSFGGQHKSAELALSNRSGAICLT